jgi:hypothetical protein
MMLMKIPYKLHYGVRLVTLSLANGSTILKINSLNWNAVNSMKMYSNLIQWG